MRSCTGSASWPLGCVYTLKFPPATSVTYLSLFNTGLLPAFYVISCTTVPFSLEDPFTAREINELRGKIESGSEVKIKVTCLLFSKNRENYRGEVRVHWQLVPGGLWMEEVVELLAKIGMEV